MRAAEAAAAGGDADAVYAAALASRLHTRTWACLVTLEFAVRGGRVPRIVRTLSDFFRITPILAMRRNGSLGIGGVLFGRINPYRAFGAFVRRRLDGRRRWRVGVSHANVPDGAALVRDEIAAALPSAEILPVMSLGTALGVHAGPGCVVVAVQELEPVS
jgi:fatty acid-binding protein DegV